MANPKYAGLPGIAPPDEKDVYETDDLPEADQDIFQEEDGENESIERPHISISEAHNRFKDKILVGGKDLDFSDRLRRRRHVGYHAVSGDWEIAAEGEKETVLQKYDRIQCEIKELLSEIEELKKKKDAKKEEVQVGVSVEPQLQEAFTQLNSLNLSASLGVDMVASISDPQGTQMKKLLTQVQTLKDTASKTSKKTQPSKQKTDDISLLTYHLQSLPEHTKLQNTARISDLEQRLKQLESVIGTSSDNLNRLKSTEYKDITEAVNDLGAKISLLDPAQVDRVEGKLTVLAARMDSIVEKRGEEENKDRDMKINELYDLLRKTESLSVSLPPIVDRLVSLKEFQSAAANFKKSLTQYETNNKNITSEINKNESKLKSLEDSLHSQMEFITNTSQNLDARLKAIKK